MGEFIRSRLPDPLEYFDLEGVSLTGPGLWKTGPCHFHGGSDSLRVNVRSGGWCCMNCGVKGGDVVAYAMQRHGMDFMAAARTLGAYIEDGKQHRGTTKARTLSAREAMQLVAFELGVAAVFIANLRAGVIPSESDWQRFAKSAGRVITLAQEYIA